MTTNTLEIARKLGYSIGGDLGAEALIELELAFASGLLPRFRNNPLIRTRQHVLLYWDPSYFKSTLLSQFAETIPQELGVVDITSMSPQMIFGSISEDRRYIIKPAFAGKRFVIITELLTFFGSGNTMKDIINTMNKVMEGEYISRQLLKFRQIYFDPAQIERLKDEGIEYDPLSAKLTYKPDVCILAASRPIDNRTYTYLRRSGHLQRYHVIQHEISDEKAKRYLTKEFHPDFSLQDKLKELNSKLMKISVKNLETPPEPVMEKIMMPLTEIARDEAQSQRLAEIIDIRTKGDIIREITVHAFLRTAVENEFKDIDRLEYTKEDLEFIHQRLYHFIEFKINPLFTEEYMPPKLKRKRRKEEAKEFILHLLDDKNLKGGKEIVESTIQAIGCSQATVHNARRELENERKICSPKYGFYKIKEDCKSCKWRNICGAAEE